MQWVSGFVDRPLVLEKQAGRGRALSLICYFSLLRTCYDVNVISFPAVQVLSSNERTTTYIK